MDNEELEKVVEEVQEAPTDELGEDGIKIDGKETE